MLTFAVARDLHAQGIGVLDEHTTAGDIYLQKMPDRPDVAIGVFSYGGRPQLTRTPYDLPNVQLRFRGAPGDPLGGLDRARQAYELWTCRDNVVLDEGGEHETFVIGCTPAQSAPVPMGVDDLDRQEWTVNLLFTVRALTPHRT